MAKYAFFTMPEYGHIYPTLAIVEELIARSEQVIYYLDERFRQDIEATGASFHPLPFRLFDRNKMPEYNSANANQLIAMIPRLMIEKSEEAVPTLLETIRAEQVD